MVSVPTIHVCLSLPALKSNSTSVPATITASERQQSAVNTACLIALRLGSSWLRYSCGICCSDLISCADTKSEKNTDGIRANNRHTPPVRAKLR